MRADDFPNDILEAVAIVRRCQKLGITLQTNRRRIRYFPASKVSSAMRERMRSCKAEIINLMSGGVEI